MLAEVAGDILKKISEPFDLEQAQAKYPVLYEESMNTVLCQELIRYNRLIRVIRSSLEALQKALVGLVVMSGDLEEMGHAMFNGHVPTNWLAVSYPTLKPLSGYITDLQQRLQSLAGKNWNPSPSPSLSPSPRLSASLILVSYSDWVEYGPPNAFWISGFFFTQSFLTGVLQNYARRHNIPIDEIGFDFEFLNTESSDPTLRQPTEGAYIHGLFLEGARWDADANQLAESHPKVLFSNSPMVKASS